jgi:hypothetical protein
MIVSLFRNDDDSLKGGRNRLSLRLPGPPHANSSSGQVSILVYHSLGLWILGGLAVRPGASYDSAHLLRAERSPETRGVEDNTPHARRLPKDE